MGVNIIEWIAMERRVRAIRREHEQWLQETFMNEAEENRAAIMRLLLAVAQGDADLAEHMYQQQYRPQEIGREMREQGRDVDIALVTTNMDRPGYEVSCISCGRKAKLPFAPPPGRAAMCPDCQRGEP